LEVIKEVEQLAKAGSNVSGSTRKTENGAAVDRKAEGEETHTQDNSPPTSSEANEFRN